MKFIKQIFKYRGKKRTKALKSSHKGKTQSNHLQMNNAEEVICGNTSHSMDSTTTDIVDQKSLPPTEKPENPLSLTINVAKKENKGEDADPLIVCQDHMFVVGVFDGMGGAGASEYTTSNGTHTGAYFASRRVQHACNEFFRTRSYPFDTDKLKTSIKQTLDNCIIEYNIKPSGLRGGIIRTLPTTLAIILAQKHGNGTQVTSYWCGDSRNYILTAKGLMQVSTDHLTKPQDPLENLRNDESLSNCVCQDKNFSIAEFDCGNYSEPLILLSATDGCFGYLRSPMHFEYILLKSLQDSQTIDEWQSRIEDELRPISGDDFSLGLIMIDKNFDYWRKTLANRLTELEKKYIHPIKRMEERIENAQKEVDEAKKAQYDGIDTLWSDYKQSFMLKKDNDR